MKSVNSRRVSARCASFMVGMLFLGLVACGEKNDPQAEQAADQKPTKVSVPTITVTNEDRVIVVRDSHGVDVELLLDVQMPELTGVSAEVSERFSDEFEGSVSDWANKLAGVVEDFQASELSCQTADGCEIPISVKTTVAEIYEGTATVLTTSGVQLGTTSFSTAVDSFALDVKTGTKLPLEKFVDLSDNSVRQSLDNAITDELQANQACQSERLQVTEETAWSPTENGVVFAWDQRSVSNACSNVQLILPWPGEVQPKEAVEQQAALVIPGCEALVSAGNVAGMGLRLESSEAGNQLASTLSGPSAQVAMSAASQVVGCTYWPAQAGDTLEHLIVSELDAPTKEAFLIALRDSDYQETEIDGADVFVLHVNAGQRGAFFSRHVFDGRAWVSLQGNTGFDAMSSIGMASEAMNVLRSENPGEM